MTARTSDEEHGPDEGTLAAIMVDAVEATLRHVASGGLPFGGVVVSLDGALTGPAFNRVRETGDPSAHAEIVAMRHAAAEGAELAGATMLATGEPCAICYAYAARVEIARVRYAISSDQAAAHGFDYRSPISTTGARRLAAAARPLRVRDDDLPFLTHSEKYRPDKD